ncbi:MAG: LysR family transcriptional regulator [Thalassotalea sp.]
MDIRVFKTFVAVAENRHFGRAAEQQYLTQAAVSARIKQLEEFYCTALFLREKNNLKLTLAGESLLAYAYIIIEKIEQSKAAINIASQQKVSFNIAATPNIWDAYLCRRVHDIDDLFAGVVLGTEISVREAIQRKLDDRTLDVALLADPIKEGDFQNALIGYFDLSLVGTSATFSPETDNYIFVDWGITYCKEHANTHRIFPIHKTSTAMIALELMLAKQGFAYLPSELAAPYIMDGVLHAIETPLQIKRPIYLVSRKDGINEVMVTELINLLTDNQ